MIQCVNHDRYGPTLVMPAIEPGESFKFFLMMHGVFENCYYNTNIRSNLNDFIEPELVYIGLRLTHLVLSHAHIYQ